MDHKTIAIKHRRPLELFQQYWIHLVLWGGVWCFYTQFLGFQTQDWYQIIAFSLFLMPVTIGTTYYSIYHLIPVYLLPKHYASFVLYAVYMLIISAYFIVLSIYGGLIFLSNYDVQQMLPITQSLTLVFIGVYLIVFIASAFALLQQNYHALAKNQMLKNNILESELKLKEQKLNYLKMQIHPHFLFNTLNTLYGFALQKSDNTPHMILKLSNLLDYLLYQVDAPWVELGQEIRHIQDYIELEKLRFQDALDINFTLDGDWEHQSIAPMLLLPFVENAFKHGSRQNGTLLIRIHLKAVGGQLHFQISNTCESSVDQERGKGIGLQNIQKRLNLLYEGQHHLSMEFKNNLFVVNLQLKHPQTSIKTMHRTI